MNVLRQGKSITKLKATVKIKFAHGLSYNAETVTAEGLLEEAVMAAAYEFGADEVIGKVTALVEKLRAVYEAKQSCGGNRDDT